MALSENPPRVSVAVRIRGAAVRVAVSVNDDSVSTAVTVVCTPAVPADSVKLDSVSDAVLVRVTFSAGDSTRDDSVSVECRVKVWVDRVAASVKDARVSVTGSEVRLFAVGA